jgi:LPXTG-motif cell wall-anchored protein
MTQSTVQIVSGILAVVLIGIVILRRKGKKEKGADDEF